MSEYVETVGYDGPPPLAIILWYKPGEDRASYKTLCYDEQAVINMERRHTTPGDLYSTLKPSIHLIGEPLQYDGIICSKAS